MAFLRVLSLATVVAVMASGQPSRAQTPEDHAQGADYSAVLINTCLITSNVKRLVDFYEPVLNVKAKWSGIDYAEFITGAGVLAIFSAASQEKYISGAAQAGKNRSLILEFRVADSDAEYRRLQSLVKVWVKPPTTQPWGTRSTYFRDPDGNLVDFYTPAKAH